MPPLLKDPAVMTALLVAVMAAVTDLKARIVPNVLIVVGLVLGFGLQIHATGMPGFLRALEGAAIGLMVFLPFYLAGGMGAGDVKLMAALGACLGPMEILRVALVASLVGAMMAVAIASRRGTLARVLRSTGRLIAAWFTRWPRRIPELTLEAPGTLTIPYAVAIAAGAMVCVLGVS
jgi:prepilin peptidase CpaA